MLQELMADQTGRVDGGTRLKKNVSKLAFRGKERVILFFTSYSFTILLWYGVLYCTSNMFLHHNCFLLTID